MAKTTQFGISYIPLGSWLHRLNGVSKLVLFMAWVIVVLTTFDLRLIATMIALGVSLLISSKVPFSNYKTLLIASGVVFGLNALFMFAIAPAQGEVYMGSSTVLLTLPLGYSLTQETLYYLIVVSLKYFSMLPIALIFVFTTHPSEFAASLNRLGVPYKIAYAINLTLRYLPQVKRDFIDIMQAKQARGVDLSKNAPLFARLKNLTLVLAPLIFSSLDRINEIANAMTLRGFGKGQKRTWYMQSQLRTIDAVVIGVCLMATSAALTKKWLDDRLFWYPF